MTYHSDGLKRPYTSNQLLLERQPTKQSFDKFNLLNLEIFYINHKFHNFDAFYIYYAFLEVSIVK